MNGSGEHSSLLIWLHFNGKLQALPANIRLALKWTVVANTLAYYDAATITALKSFIVQARGVKKLAFRRKISSCLLLLKAEK